MIMNYDKAKDRGLEGVIACTTKISSIINKTLTYRGYKIEELVELTFEEIVYLLWSGELPSTEALSELKARIADKLTLDNSLIDKLKLLPIDCHPMEFLRSAVSIISMSSHGSDQMESCHNLLAKMGMLVCAFDRFRNSKEVVKPKLDKSIAWNFLYCLNGEEPDDETASIFDKCLIIHADHELNCSTFAARVTASSRSDIYSAVISAIGTLKGPLHGGANEKVMLMLKEIGSVDQAKLWIEKALNKKQLIMGFGHRVYKEGDPRASLLKIFSETLAKKGDSTWFEISKVLEQVVKEEKGLLPNVDFYSASTYYSMGIPIDLYTPIFASSRISGWIAHILEQQANNRIYRPRGEYVGHQIRKLPKN